MKIKQEEITKKIEEQDYLQDLETIKYSEITKTKLKNIAYKRQKAAETSGNPVSKAAFLRQNTGKSAINEFYSCLK